WVGHEQVGVDLLLRAEAGAAGTGAMRRVEGENPRLELGQRDAVVRARELLAEEHRVAFDDVDRDEAVRELRRGLHRLREPRAQIRLHRQAVHDHFDRVLELLVEGDLLLEEAELAVDLYAGEALVSELFEDVLVLPLPVADDRGVDGEPRPVRELQDLVDDRLLTLAGDRLAADRAVRTAYACVEEA